MVSIYFVPCFHYVVEAGLCNVKYLEFSNFDIDLYSMHSIWKHTRSLNLKVYQMKIFEEKQTLSIETMFKSLFIIVRQGEGIYYLAPSRNNVDANVHR